MKQTFGRLFRRQIPDPGRLFGIVGQPGGDEEESRREKLGTAEPVLRPDRQNFRRELRFHLCRGKQKIEASGCNPDIWEDFADGCEQTEALRLRNRKRNGENSVVFERIPDDPEHLFRRKSVRCEGPDGRRFEKKQIVLFLSSRKKAKGVRGGKFEFAFLIPELLNGGEEFCVCEAGIHVFDIGHGSEQKRRAAVYFSDRRGMKPASLLLEQGNENLEPGPMERFAAGDNLCSVPENGVRRERDPSG